MKTHTSIAMLFMLCFGTAWGQRGGTYQHQHNSHSYHHNSNSDNHHHHHTTRTYRRPAHYSNWSPVCTHDFDIGCRNISSCRSDRNRLRAAKKFVACHHVTVQQVNCILNMFAYERNRLAFAKYAYSRTCDRSNYNQLYSSFAYRSSCRELNMHISGF